MDNRGRWNLWAIARTVALAAVLALASGYVVFYGVFPAVSLPASSEPSLLLMLAILSATSLLVGLATEDLVQMVFQSFLALFLSGVVAAAMALSPILVGVVFVQPDSIPTFLVHYGFLLFALGFVTDLVGGTLGLVLRERYFFTGARATPRSWERK